MEVLWWLEKIAAKVWSLEEKGKRKKTDEKKEKIEKINKK